MKSGNVNVNSCEYVELNVNLSVLMVIYWPTIFRQNLCKLAQIWCSQYFQTDSFSDEKVTSTTVLLLISKRVINNGRSNDGKTFDCIVFVCPRWRGVR